MTTPGQVFCSLARSGSPVSVYVIIVVIITDISDSFLPVHMQTKNNDIFLHCVEQSRHSKSLHLPLRNKGAMGMYDRLHIEGSYSWPPVCCLTPMGTF